MKLFTFISLILLSITAQSQYVYDTETGNFVYKNGIIVQSQTQGGGGGTELVTNGDIEAALPSINGNAFVEVDAATVTQSTEQAHAGSNSAKYVVGVEGQEAYQAPSYAGAGLSGTDYTLVFWLYVPSGQSWGSGIFGVSSNGATNGTTNWLVLNGGNGDFTFDTWVEKTVNITEEGDETFVFDFTSVATDGDFLYIDDISFTED